MHPAAPPPQAHRGSANGAERPGNMPRAAAALAYRGQPFTADVKEAEYILHRTATS